MCPIRVFKCRKCKEITERILKHNPEKYVCSECGFTADKIITSSAFKINGFSFKNGYSKEN